MRPVIRLFFAQASIAHSPAQLISARVFGMLTVLRIGQQYMAATNSPLIFIIWAAACFIAGFLIFFNRDTLATLDQTIGLKVKTYREKHSKFSFLNRELWPVGSFNARRVSRTLFLVVGLFAMFAGTAMLLVAFLHSFWE
jgi:hypothetical protein